MTWAPDPTHPKTTMSLSTSTTSTTAYTLTKYSRAYPSASRAQDSEAEWQHFTNPTIRLILEMRKSSSGELESYRSRVLWSLNSGDDSMDVDQNEVTFVRAYKLFFEERLNVDACRRTSSYFPSLRLQCCKAKSSCLPYTVYLSRRSIVMR